MGNVLDKNESQEYRRIISVYSLSHDNLLTPKIWPVFQSYHFRFCHFTPKLSTLGLISKSNEGGSRLLRDSERLDLSVFNQLLSPQILGLLGTKAI